MPAVYGAVAKTLWNKKHSTMPAGSSMRLHGALVLLAVVAMSFGDIQAPVSPLGVATAPKLEPRGPHDDMHEAWPDENAGMVSGLPNPPEDDPQIDPTNLP